MKPVKTVKTDTFALTNGQNSSSVVRRLRGRPERSLHRALWRAHCLLDVGQEAPLSPGLRGRQQGELGQLRPQRGHLRLKRGHLLILRHEKLKCDRYESRLPPRDADGHNVLTCSSTVLRRVSASADFLKRSFRSIRSVSLSDVSLSSRDKINWTKGRRGTSVRSQFLRVKSEWLLISQSYCGSLVRRLISIAYQDAYWALNNLKWPVACLHRAAPWHTFPCRGACSDRPLEKQQEEQGEVLPQSECPEQENPEGRRSQTTAQSP